MQRKAEVIKAGKTRPKKWLKGNLSAGEKKFCPFGDKKLDKTGGASINSRQLTGGFMKLVLIFGLFFGFDIQAGFLSKTEASGLETLPFYSALLKGDLPGFSEQWDGLSPVEKNKAFRLTTENGDNLIHLFFRVPSHKERLAEKVRVILWEKVEQETNPLKIFQMLTHKNTKGETPFDMIQDDTVKREFQSRLYRLSERIEYDNWNHHAVKAALSGMVSFFLFKDSLAHFADGEILEMVLQTGSGLITAGLGLFFCKQAFSSMTTLQAGKEIIIKSHLKEDMTQGTSVRPKM